MHHITYILVNFIFNHHLLGIDDFQPSISTGLEATFFTWSNIYSSVWTECNLWQCKTSKDQQLCSSSLLSAWLEIINL